MTEKKDKKSRSGSQTRKRNKSICVAFTPDELAEVMAKAEAAGLNAGNFLRKCGMDRATPRTQRRAPHDRAALEKAIMDLRRVGNNINQLAKLANMNEPADSVQLNQALDEYAATLRLLREASGR
jgi:hypothetical protein